MVDWSALRASLELAATTTVVLMVLAMPLAWWLASGRSVARVIVNALVSLPLVLPPTVLGFYLLVLLGPRGPLGRALESIGGPRLVFTFTGLVVGSTVFSLPFVVQPLRDGFLAIGRRPLEVASTLRAGPLDRFISVALPMCWRSVLSAVILGFAHTLGEFGVILLIGGNIPGETRVASIAVFEAVESLDYAAAHTLSAILLGFSFVVLLLVHGLLRPRPRAGAGTP
jgi:molybdate transport system permease protein